MKQTIIIEVPEGKTYKQYADEFGNLVIQYIDKKPVRSKSWEEFCKNHPIIDIGETYVGRDGAYKSSEVGLNRRPNRNYLATPEDAEGILALIQLTRLHDEWVGDWKCTDKNNLLYWVIYYEAICESPKIEPLKNTKHLLSFPSEEMTKDFLLSFKDLIEKAKKFI